MRTKAKLAVILAFSARLPVIAAAAVRLHYLQQRFLGRSNTFEHIVATQWQLGYAIMSSTITGMGPFLRPFSKEYTTSHHKRSGYGYGYGQSSQRSNMPSQSRGVEVPGTRSRSSWHSEGYLMEPISSRRGSKTALSDSTEPGVLSPSSTIHRSTVSASSILEPQQYSSSSQAPIMLKADTNFRPIDPVSRNDTEIWVGDRSGSFGTEEDMPKGLRDDRVLVINKRTQVKIEVDRASRVV